MDSSAALTFAFRATPCSPLVPGALLPTMQAISRSRLPRLFAQEKPVYSGYALGVVDEKNIPASGEYTGPIDFEKLYAKLWRKG